MIRVRKAKDRGSADHGWLKTNHTFSFASYQDPQHIQFRSLRVMNEDWIAPGQGFGTHPHENMEIVTYVLSGALEHRDSMGNGEVLRPGEFQRMSAGTGITHSEFNPSPTESTHLYQIWLRPAEKGITPSYEQRRFEDSELTNRLCVVASPEAEDNALLIHQDARIMIARMEAAHTLQHVLEAGRSAWLQVLRGTVDLNGITLNTSDGAAISDVQTLDLTANEKSEVMLFDLA